MTDPNSTSLLAEQAEYYRARAAEYDEWFLREGRYDRGPAASAAWFAQVEEVRAALDAFQPTGDVLELACGTGLWTARLLRHAGKLTCVDASAEMIELNRARVRSTNVEYVRADLFAWEPTRTYDTIFFGFWLSHVPPARFGSFWGMVRGALAPGGRVFFVDSLLEPSSMAVNHSIDGPRDATVTRKLNDGREFKVVKVFYEPDELAAGLVGLGFVADVRATSTYFLYGWAAASG